MRTLTLPIDERLAGRTVKSLLAQELRMSESLIRRVKLRETQRSLRSKTRFRPIFRRLASPIPSAGWTGARRGSSPLQKTAICMSFCAACCTRPGSAGNTAASPQAP